MLAELNLAQSRLERDPACDWWFLIKWVTLDIASGQSVVTLPPDYIRIAEQTVPVLLNADGTPLGKLARAYYEDALFADASQPAVYVLGEGALAVYPKPEQEYKLRFAYVKADVPLSSSVLENQWTKFGYTLLMNKAGIALAQAIQHKDALGNFAADYAASYKETFNETVAHSDATFSQVRE